MKVVGQNSKIGPSKGNIHVLRKHKGGREGVSQMLTIAYVGGGGLRDHAYVMIFGIFFALDRKITKKIL